MNASDQVLVLLLEHDSWLLAKWEGPFKVVCRIGLVDFEVDYKAGVTEGPTLGRHLIKQQEHQLWGLVAEYQDVFCIEARKAEGVVHQIAMPEGCVIHETWRRIS